MDTTQHRGHLRRELDRVVGLLDEADPRADVPSCPAWDVDALASHLAEVLTRWEWIAARGEDAPPDRSLIPPPDEGDDLAERVREPGERLLTTLADLGADAPVWNWSSGDHTAAWLARRLAHELQVHRVDLEQAMDVRNDLDPLLAVDGIDEVLQVFLSSETDGADAAVALDATDVDRQWVVDLHGAAPSVTGERGDGDVDATLTGRAEDVLLALWSREEPQVEGDVEVVPRFLALLRT